MVGVTVATSAWQQLASLKPALAKQVDIQRRHYGDELWFLLQDKVHGRFHRFSPRAYQLLSLMDGRRTVAKIHADAQQLPVPDQEQSATEAELIELLQYLHVADLLVCDVPPSSAELFQRRQAQKSQKWKALTLNPVVWRLPLGNPDKFLDRLQPLAELISSRFMALLWCVVVAYGLLQTITHWDQISSNQLGSLLSAQNLLLLWLTYPLLKVLHEFGHALCTKAWGGHIHEFGVVVIMGVPLPYVDATAATAFAQKSRRLMVSAAGMAVELFLAALALLLWLQIEDGLMRAILFNIMVLGSISTLFFNGNPLLRFDGYHLLCDWLDSPNLGARANQQLSYAIQHYGYGINGLQSPASHNREACALIAYALAAFCYRLLILGVIILLAAEYFPTVGVILGLWLIVFQLAIPAIKKLVYLCRSPVLAQHRRRAILTSSGALAFIALFIGFMPLPHNTHAEGVVWLPNEARVRAESRGFIEQVYVQDGERVSAGTPLIQLSNPKLQTELLTQQAVLQEYQARYQKVWKSDRTQAALFVEDIDAITAEISLLQERVQQLTLSSASAGVFTLQRRNPLGSFVEQGEQIAIVTLPQSSRVRVALNQNEIALVQHNSHSIEVRLSSQLNNTLNASLIQQTPAATQQLPSLVLGASGGGRMSIDQSVAGGLQTQDMIFLMDVELPLADEHDATSQHLYGQRAYLKFEHSSTSIGTRIYRILQQHFLQLAAQ